MRIGFLVVPALLGAGTAVAQVAARPDPLDARAKVPPVEFRSAFEGYRRYADPQMRDWRKSDEELGAADGHTDHRPGQGPRQPTSNPQAGKPENSHERHEGHK